MKQCTFKISRIGWETEKSETEERTGYEVDIFGLRCFVDRRGARCWTITEAMTGFAFASGDTRAKAIERAEHRLRSHCKGFIAEGLLKAAHSIGTKGLSWPVNAIESREENRDGNGTD